MGLSTSLQVTHAHTINFQQVARQKFGYQWSDWEETKNDEREILISDKLPISRCRFDRFSNDLPPTFLRMCMWLHQRGFKIVADDLQQTMSISDVVAERNPDFVTRKFTWSEKEDQQYKNLDQNASLDQIQQLAENTDIWRRHEASLSNKRMIWALIFFASVLMNMLNPFVEYNTMFHIITVISSCAIGWYTWAKSFHCKRLYIKQRLLDRSLFN